MQEHGLESRRTTIGVAAAGTPLGYFGSAELARAPARDLLDRPQADRNSAAAVITRPEPWFEADTQHLEYIQRARFWRFLTGDDGFDADYWLTRIENEPG